jgi:hypothetical protein
MKKKEIEIIIDNLYIANEELSNQNYGLVRTYLDLIKRDLVSLYERLKE